MDFILLFNLSTMSFLISCCLSYSGISFFSISSGLHLQYHDILESLYLSYNCFEIPDMTTQNQSDMTKTVYLQKKYH
jgi:hypothetical protein